MTAASALSSLTAARRLRHATAALLAAGLALPPLPAASQAREKRTIIRDTEIEQLMRDYTAPVMRAAGIRSGSVKVVLVGGRQFNAFVADGKHIFINVGAIMDANTPNEIISVLAHESGHIAGGHLARLREQLANAQIFAVAGMLLGGAAVVGAANSGGRVGSSGAGTMGAITGAQEMARRSLLAYQRSEEQAADLAAVRFLEATKQSPRGLLDTFKRFANESLFRTASVDPYLLSHPLPQERIASLETLVAKSPYRDAKDPPALQARHDLARAKLYGFIERRETTLRKYPPSDTSTAARYARAITAYRHARLEEALTGVEALLREQPENPNFWELKGQALLESGRVKEAIPSLRKAVSLAPSSGLIRGMLGRALVASDNNALTDEAIRELANAAQREPEAPDAYRDLATAYARKGNIGLAELNSAQAYFNSGQWSEAASQATRAMTRLPLGSPGWLKAEDIVNYRPPRSQKQ